MDARRACGREVIALVALCIGLARPVPASGQPAGASTPGEPPLATWILAGADLAVHDRWRGLVRVGHLGEIDSRLVLAEAAFVASPAIHVLAGGVLIAPTARNAADITLLRAGGTWLPVRRRLTIENRLLLERRSTAGAGSSARGRNRLRITVARPGGLPFGVFGSVETIAERGRGVVENRIQAGATRSVGRLFLEGYWLHRRLPAQTVVNGFGVTAAWGVKDHRARPAAVRPRQRPGVVAEDRARHAAKVREGCGEPLAPVGAALMEERRDEEAP